MLRAMQLLNQKINSMKLISFLQSKMLYSLVLFAFIFLLNFKGQAQITSYQYRHVPDNKVDEFIKRETTYWSKIAQKAIDAKKMTFWALFEKVGGYDLPNSSNFLFINTFPNIDSAFASKVFNTKAVFPNIPYSQIETGSFTTVTSQFFLHAEDWAEAAGVNPMKDFNYLVMNYHNSSDPSGFITTEKTVWKPFFQIAADKKQTAQVAWGNAIVLSPAGDNIKFNTVSYDLFRTLQDALLTPWDPAVVFPTEGLNQLDKIRLNRSGRTIYRIVKVVSAN